MPLCRSVGPPARHKALFPYKSLREAIINICLLCRSAGPSAGHAAHVLKTYVYVVNALVANMASSANKVNPGILLEEPPLHYMLFV